MKRKNLSILGMDLQDRLSDKKRGSVLKIKPISAKMKQLVAKERTKEDQIRLKRELHKREKNHDQFCKNCKEL